MRALAVALVVAAGCTKPAGELEARRGDGGVSVDGATVATADAGFLEARLTPAPRPHYGERRSCREVCAEASLVCVHDPRGPWSLRTHVTCDRPEFHYEIRYRCDDPLGTEIPGCLSAPDPVESPSRCLCGAEASSPTPYVVAPVAAPSLVLRADVRVLHADALPGSGETCGTSCGRSGLACLSFEASETRPFAWGPASFGMTIECGRTAELRTARCDEPIGPPPCPLRPNSAGCVCVAP